jgi:hypothetical protein
MSRLHEPRPGSGSTGTQSATKRNKSPFGVVLVDPTVTEGFPLWYDRANWLPIPDVEDPGPPPSKSSGFLLDIVQKTITYPWYSSTDNIDLRMIIHPTIYTICAEWLLVCKYVNTRLSQIEWQLDMPSMFAPRGPKIDRCLRSLGTWRRHLPVWKDMVNDTLDEVLPAVARLTNDAKAHETTKHSKTSL